jgi:hypothetical protein
MGVAPSDTFCASKGSRGAGPAGNIGNTHVVPPKCRIAQQPNSKFEPRPPNNLRPTYHARQSMSTIYWRDENNVFRS